MRHYVSIKKYIPALILGLYAVINVLFGKE
jgi:hypothetical protein